MDRREANMYYVALVCPPDIDQQILQLKQMMKNEFGCVNAMKSPAHITLVAPFWISGHLEPELIKTTDSFQSKIGHLSLSLNGFSHFNQRVLFVTVTENQILEQLKKETEAWFADHVKEIRIDERPFHPHVTIATRDMKPSHFIKAWEYFSDKEFSASFDIQQISLMKLNSGKWNIIRQKDWKE